MNAETWKDRYYEDEGIYTFLQREGIDQVDEAGVQEALDALQVVLPPLPTIRNPGLFSIEPHKLMENFPFVTFAREILKAITASK